MQYAYVFLWAVLAVILFVAGFKQGAFAFVMSGCFAFMTVWYALRAFWGYPMFNGVLGVVYRCVLGAFLALIILLYFLSKRRGNKK